MSAAIDITAAPSFDTQMFSCEIKLNYKKKYNIFIKTNIYYNELKTKQETPQCVNQVFTHSTKY